MPKREPGFGILLERRQLGEMAVSHGPDGQLNQMAVETVPLFALDGMILLSQEDGKMAGVLWS